MIGLNWRVRSRPFSAEVSQKQSRAFTSWERHILRWMESWRSRTNIWRRWRVRVQVRLHSLLDLQAERVLYQQLRLMILHIKRQISLWETSMKRWTSTMLHFQTSRDRLHHPRLLTPMILSRNLQKECSPTEQIFSYILEFDCVAAFYSLFSLWLKIQSSTKYCTSSDSKGIENVEPDSYGKRQDIKISTVLLLLLLCLDITMDWLDSVIFYLQTLELMKILRDTQKRNARRFWLRWNLDTPILDCGNWKKLACYLITKTCKVRLKSWKITLRVRWNKLLWSIHSRWLLLPCFFHEYQKSAAAWINCSEQSAWSPTLYHYMAGASYVELYRNTRLSDPTAAKVHKKQATEFLLKAPPLAGKQKVMAKQLPFDIYIVSKVGKWEQRAKTWNVDLVDAIGPSPFVEMIYFWNGVKKSGNVELQKCLDLLEENRMTCPEKCNEDEDDKAIHLLLRGCVVRNMGRYEEARKILKGEIVDSERYCPSLYLCLSWTR